MGGNNEFVWKTNRAKNILTLSTETVETLDSKQARDCSPAAARSASGTVVGTASAAVFVAVLYRTQLTGPRLCTSCYYLVFLHVLFFGVGSSFGIPDGGTGGAGALGTLSRSQGWPGSSPETDRVRERVWISVPLIHTLQQPHTMFV
eukprot:6209226-Pleurochrysis_carterae.AAC.1